MVNPVKPLPFGFTPAQGLDAGQVFNVTGPKGSRQVLKRYTGMYSECSPMAPWCNFWSPEFTPWRAHRAGPTWGHFMQLSDFPAELTSTVQQSARGTTVNWRGGDPQGYVVIQGSAQSPAGTSTNFSCVERTSAGQFAIPSYLLASLPAPPAGVTAMTAAGSSPQNRFQARGLDFGFFSFCSPLSALCSPSYYFEY